MQLRPYQEKMIDEARAALKRNSRILLQGPTGCGKTAITVYMMSRAAAQGKRAWFLVHQNELLSQTSKALWRQKLEHGMIASGKAMSKMPSQVASVQTLVRRLDKYGAPDLIIIDECHRSAANTYQIILDRYPDAKVIGLTATPQRTDKRGLDETYGEMVQGPTIRQLIDAGYLCEYEMYAPPVGADISGVKKRMGDFDTKELEERMDKPTITGNAVQHYMEFARGKRNVVMCVSIKHAEHVCSQFKASGVAAAVIEGKMTGAERDKVIADFEAGTVQVVCNYALLVEGVDLPAIEVVTWLRPTQSLVVWMQGNGRGLRPAPGKSKLIIFDHVGNHARHGLPDDDREWTLAGEEKGKRKKNEEPDVLVKQCSACWSVFRPGPTHCPTCGEPVAGPAREIEVVDGKLEKIDLEAARREKKREQGSARTLDELVSLGMRRGMNKPAQWAALTMAARVQQKPTPALFKQADEIYRRAKNAQGKQRTEDGHASAF